MELFTSKEIRFIDTYLKNSEYIDGRLEITDHEASELLLLQLAILRALTEFGNFYRTKYSLL